MKFDYSSPQGNDCFIGKNTSTGGNSFLFGVWNNKIYLQVDTHYRNDPPYIDGSTGLDLYDGNWHHIVASVDEDYLNPGTSDVSLWIDGVQKWNRLQVSDLMEATDVNDGYKPTIGMERDGSTKSDYLEGKIDELKVFKYGNPTSADISNLYNARFGVEVENNIWTNAIRDYDNYTILTGSNDEADGFIYESQHMVNQYYPVVLTSYVQKKGADVDRANLTNHNQDYYEIVFNAGHGSHSGFRPQDGVSIPWPHDTIAPTDYTSTSGNDNVGSRWVFYHACRVLKYAWFDGDINGGSCPNYDDGPCCYNGSDFNRVTAPCYDDDNGDGVISGLEDWFEERFADTDGPNAIFGFASLMVHRSSGSDTPPPPAQCFGEYCYIDDSNYSDYDENAIHFGHDFWEDVIRDNVPIWNAYKQAVLMRMVPYIGGVRPVIVYRKDDATGFDGSKESFNNIYRPRSNSNMIIATDSIEHGNPTY